MTQGPRAELRASVQDDGTLLAHLEEFLLTRASGTARLLCCRDQLAVTACMSAVFDSWPELHSP
jgi:hypothetical protein